MKKDMANNTFMKLFQPNEIQNNPNALKQLENSIQYANQTQDFTSVNGGDDH